jgi:hypothetical protein
MVLEGRMMQVAVCPLLDVRSALRVSSIAFRYYRMKGVRPAPNIGFERQALAAGFPLDTTASFRVLSI